MISHYSISQLQTFESCGERYRRRYPEGEIIPPAIPAHIGKGVHKAGEINYTGKLDSGEDMPLDAFKDAAAESYQRNIMEGVFFAPDEVSGAKLALAEGKDKTVALAALYRESVAPQVTPLLVEKKILIDLPGVPLPIMTVLDLYTADKSLRDIKTTSKKWAKGAEDASPQPTAYREAVKAFTGEEPESIQFDVLVSTAVPAYQPLPTKRTDEDTAILARHFVVMHNAITAGIFMPADPGFWGCSPKWCGYFMTCPYISIHRKRLPNV
jgi:hypothetical protein